LKVRVLDALQNRFRLFSYKDDEIDEFVHKLRDAAFLSGYSSMVYEIARRINERGLNKEFKLKMVKGTSEKIYDSYRMEVESAFNRKLTSEYGAAEAGIIAFECSIGNMHMTMETVIAEEKDHEIVVTNLVSKSFPIIRYKLGDYVKLDLDTKCPCGMAHHIVKEVTGRVGKVIYGLRHQYPSLMLYYVFKNLAMEYNVILNYRATQREKGHLQMEIEKELKKGQKALLIEEFEKYFGNDVELEIRDKVAFRENNRKKVDFISEL
jgi:phenylacetate-CoA ligase